MKNFKIYNTFYFYDLFGSDYLFFYIFFIVMFALIYFKAHMQILAGRRIVEDWARRFHYKILKLQHRWIYQGPFHEWRHRDGSQVFYLEVEAEDGKNLKAFVRCYGSRVYVIGDEEEDVEVKWVD